MATHVSHCPSCSGALEVRELYCPTCDIQLRGNFETRATGPLARLSEDQLAFLRLFVTSRGNLSDIERTLGVSYPTVRAKVDDLIGAMQEPDIESQPPQPRFADASSLAHAAANAAATVPLVHASTSTSTATLGRREILARIADGRMSPQEGFVLLKQAPADDR